MRLRNLTAFGLLLGFAFGTAQAERSAADLERDARDQPQAIMQFAGVSTGMQIADLFGRGGYYSELLAEAVGESGHVLLYNNPAYAAYGRDALTQRFANGTPKQIAQRVAAVEDMGLGQARFDRAFLVMSLHDVYWVNEKEGWPAIDRDLFLRQVVAALKPGGALLVVDHRAPDGFDISQVDALHRIDPAFVQAELERHGLKLEKTSNLLQQAGDDRSLNVFNPQVRGKTDRFVHLYRKPASGG